MINQNYKHILTPIKINSMVLRNRIIAAPAGGSMEEKAIGGAASVIANSVPVDCDKSHWVNNAPYPFSRYEVEKQRKILNSAHYGGAKAGVELFHAGMWCRVDEGDFSWGPCDTYLEAEKRNVKAVDEKEMKIICDGYAKTARDAKELGYDFLFLHFAHGWLVSSFLSPHFNHRTDEYGGSIENRSKFPLMILKAIRDAVGPDYPIEMRVNADDKLENSIVFEDVIKFVQMAEPYIDSVQISCGQDMVRAGNVHMCTTNLLPHMYNVAYASELKKHVKKVKVSVVGAINTIDEAEKILAEGKADMVAMGRPFIADPELINKVIDGKPEDITPCLRCMLCYHISTDRKNVVCSVNPHFNRQVKEITITNSPKTVVVVGAGPAGITAALEADKVGHHVILIEKENEVGGLIRYISKEHYKVEYNTYLNYLKAQLNKSKVDVRLGVKASPEYVKNLNPDRVIVAIGGDLIVPNIKGIDNKNVLNCFEAIEHPEKIGENVAVIGGGVVGIEIALGLAEVENKKITVIEKGNQLYSTANELYKIGLSQKIEENKERINIILNADCKEITDDSIVYEIEGKQESYKVDTIIVATGIKAKSLEAESYYGITSYTQLIGDCLKPRIVAEAVFEGFSAGNKK